MGLLTFKGGIHPKDGKALAKDQPIKELLPLGELVYPLSQHIGAPAVPLVKKRRPCLKRTEDCGSRRICICAGLRIRGRNCKSNRNEIQSGGK